MRGTMGRESSSHVRPWGRRSEWTSSTVMMAWRRPSTGMCCQLKIRLLLGNKEVLSQPEADRAWPAMLRRPLGDMELELGGEGSQI